MVKTIVLFFVCAKPLVYKFAMLNPHTLDLLHDSLLLLRFKITDKVYISSIQNLAVATSTCHRCCSVHLHLSSVVAWNTPCGESKVRDALFFHDTIATHDWMRYCLWPPSWLWRHDGRVYSEHTTWFQSNRNDCVGWAWRICGFAH